jgi:YegS/Rv2252/BmrU family lipid kinase
VSFRAHRRTRLLPWALLSLAVLVTLSVLVRLDLPLVDRYDGMVGREPEAWTFSQPYVVDFLLVVAHVFDTLALTVATALTVLGLLLRKHRRAAAWVVTVMAGASLTTYLLKRFFQRDRPVWEDPVTTISGYAFPSGHSSGIASAAGVAIVLALLLVRRRATRRLVVGVAAFLVLLVGADRIMLGVHNLSDVVAGYSVGALWVLTGLLLFDPSPRRRNRQPHRHSPTSSRKLAVVLNPVKVEDVGAFKEMVGRMAAEGGWAGPDWYETTIEDPGRSMAEQAAIDDAAMVLVCGGDGTVRTVCAELAGTGIPVGVVPAGTGNLLARNLGVPLFLQAAVDVALNGQDRAIDLVRISGDGIAEDEHFMVMAGMGFDAAIMEGANEQIKARVGWLAYVFSGFRNIMFPAVRMEISVDDGPWTRHRARTAVVGNVGYLQAGMPLLPDAAIDDGVLDLVILHPRRFLSWIPLAFRVISKGRRLDETLDRRTGRKVSIRASVDTPRQVDGDPIGAGRELHCECVHGRLLVRVPR